ncbi:ATP-grasp domain-containing protein [Paracoccus litorisediminis]|uniref:ATP-grasp domain-containing protein n=1 Tax=Paracoccus litorisediminis TaxID=2006130 RepID=UPI0037331B19
MNDIDKLSVTVVLQEEICRDVPVALSKDSPHRIIRFSSEKNWREHLARIEAHLLSAGGGHPARVLCFVSLDVAKYIRHHFPLLRRGVILQEEDLAFRSFAGWLGGVRLLNESYFILPLDELKKRKEQLRRIYGQRIFLRPDSSMKQFAGQVIHLDDLEFELNSLIQVHHLTGDLLVVVDRAREIAEDEYRFWLVGGGIATMAGYNHRQVQAKPCPEAIHQAAERYARWMEAVIEPVVADFVMGNDGEPRLVELNAVSTSGFYAGMDANALIVAMNRLFA